MLEANFISGYETVTVQGLTQWDKGQKLQITGLSTLPATFQVHFANITTVEAIVMLGSTAAGVGTVDIPNSLLEAGLDVKAWIYIIDAEGSETIKTILFPLTKRTKPADFISEPNPAEQSLLEEIMTTLNTATANTQAQINSTNSQVALKANQTSLDATNAIVAQKADKSEVTNIMTPKGNLSYASLPTTGNTVGWYYYCPDGDGTHGAGNYVWNGTAWYFGGTGDQGYNMLKSDIDDVSDEIVRDNLIKPANIEIGYFSVRNSKLKKETNSTYRRIENIKIPLVNDGKVYIRTEGYSKIFFQNSDKTVVSSATLAADHTRVQNVEIPENVTFLSMFWGISVLTEIGEVFVSTTKSELKKFFYENFSLPNYDFSENVDNTLTIPGKAADAKVVGDAIKSIFDGKIDGKIMLFAGDSICYGANWRPTPEDYSTTGWRKLVQEKYPTAKTYGYGIGGTTIAIRANRTDSIYERLTKMYSDHSDADYVILQGGLNDCWGRVPLGEITENYNKELDTSTFCGAMEKLLKDSILKWKGKKIGFICTYKVHDADTIINGGEIVWDFKSYMDKAKEICDKWSVPYCDLYNESGLCLKLDDIANTYSDGGTHVNELGYRIIFPKIDAWLKTL